MGRHSVWVLLSLQARVPTPGLLLPSPSASETSPKWKPRVLSLGVGMVGEGNEDITKSLLKVAMYGGSSLQVDTGIEGPRVH